LCETNPGVLDSSHLKRVGQVVAYPVEISGRERTSMRKHPREETRGREQTVVVTAEY
jgi:hypothetical protein